MAPVSWVAGIQCERFLYIDGMQIDIKGSRYDKSSRKWRPVELFFLSVSDNCKLCGDANHLSGFINETPLKNCFDSFRDNNIIRIYRHND